jgi:hypothetical protein
MTLRHLDEEVRAILGYQCVNMAARISANTRGAMTGEGAMEAFNVAFARDHQSDMVIVPVEASFSDLCRSAQQKIIDRIGQSAENAGLKGVVVTVWDKGGKLGFRAPLALHAYLRSRTMGDIRAGLSAHLDY